MADEADEKDLAELIREAADQAARDWDEPEKLLEMFQEMNRRSRRDIAAGVLRLLVQDYGKDVIGRVAEEAGRDQKRETSDWGFRILFDAFCEVLPELSFDVTALANALHAAFLTKAHVGAVYKAIENLSRRSRETAELLFRTFVARADSPLVALVSSVLLGLAYFDLREAHGRALSMTCGEVLALRRVGLNALGLFRYSDTDGDLIQLTLRRLEELRSMPDPETDDLLVKAYGVLLDRVEEARQAILDLAKRPIPAVQAAVGYILYQRDKSDSRSGWYREALLSLACVASSQRDTLDSLDHCVAVCAREDPEFAADFLEAFVRSRAYRDEGEESEITEVMADTIIVMCKEAAAVKAMITRWFASSDPRLHQAAWDLAGHGHFGNLDSELPVFELSKPTLDALSEEVVRVIVERVLGYAIFGRPQAALVASVLRRDPLTPAVASFVEEALRDILYNYPETAEKYLRSRLAQNGVVGTEREVIERALARSEEYFSALKNRPRINELRPPSHRLRFLWRAEQKRNDEIMASAREKSVFMSLMPTVYLKFGGSFFTEVDGAFTEPTSMGRASEVFERARGGFIDPLGQLYLRMRRKAAGLQVVKEEEEP